jgi:cation:H+ antiporter
VNVILWAAILLLAVWAAHWGAEHLADPLKKLRRQWGFSVAAGGSFIGLATASPEVGINITSAARGVGDIGLGAMLGANIIVVPILVVTAYVATRKRDLGGEHRDHQSHLRENFLPVDAGAVTVQALPYLGILALVALLTLPTPWRGLQPIDGWILLIAYFAYLAQALLRGREKGEAVTWERRERWQALAGLAALAVGAYLTVLSTEQIVSALGISKIVGGLFITAPVAALPEVFATWTLARNGQITAAATDVIGDMAATMTIAFIPLTIVTTAIQDLHLFWVSLASVAIMATLYAGLLWWGGPTTGFRRWQVLAFPIAYALYVAVVVFWVQPFGTSSS